MSIVAHTIIKPLSGKRQAAESRVRQISGIYARHGAAVKATKFVAGPHAGCLAVLRGYPDFKTAVKTLQAVNADPAYLEFEREREANPQAEIVSGRNISRRVFGEGRWGTHPVTLARGYEMTRTSCQKRWNCLVKSPPWSQTMTSMSLVWHPSPVMT